LRILLFQIADDGLPTIVHMDVLDADKLLPTVTQASKDLNLGGISFHQTSRCRSERRNAALTCKGDVQLGENRHGGCVRTGHLDGERSLDFVLRRCGFDQQPDDDFGRASLRDIGP
jgi:hypothetical protein